MSGAASPAHTPATSGAASVTGAENGESGHAGDHACTCLGSCDAPSSASLPLAGERSAVGDELTVVSRAHTPVEWIAHSSQALLLLPFPTAPPFLA